MKALVSAFLALLLLTPAAVPARAASAAGAESFDFLLFDAGVRAAALGGAYTALATDANALAYNPAGLDRVKTNEATFMHSQYVEGLTQEYVALATSRGWGLNLNRLSFGGVTRTRFDAPNGGIGSAGMTGLAIGGGYGHKLSETISVGAGAKFLRETIDDAWAGGFAVDAGVLADVPRLPGLSLGAALLNVGPRVRFQSRQESLPLLGRAGAAYAFRVDGTDNTAVFDVTKARTDDVRFGLGAETVIAKVLACRLGFTGRNDAGVGLTAGVGFIWKALAVDFAFVPFGDLGTVHRVGLTFRWGSEAARDSSRAALSEAAREQNDVANLFRIRYNARLGRMSFSERDYAGAKNYFAQAIMLASNAGVKDAVVDDAYAGMGESLREEGNAADAEKFFKAAKAGPSIETSVFVRKQLGDR